MQQNQAEIIFMKNTLLFVLAATGIALGALCLNQSKKLAAQNAQLVSLRSELGQKSRELEDQQAHQQLAAKQRSELFDQVDDLAAKLQAQRIAAARAATSAPAATPPSAVELNPKTDKAGFGKFISSLMEDPETKKFIRDQQWLVLNQLYTPLIKQLGLTPEEAGQFKELLLDNQMKAAEKAGSLFSGDSAINQTNILGTLAAKQKSFDAQVKELRGDARYAQYKDYQQTVSERMQLNQFQQQTAGGENALTEQQTEQLLAFMRDAKQNVAATTGQAFPGAGQNQAGFQAMLSDDSLEKLLQAQATVNQQVNERAQTVLSPAQLNLFASFQTNQLQMMRVGIGMARKMMGSGASGGAAPATPAAP